MSKITIYCIDCGEEIKNTLIKQGQNLNCNRCQKKMILDLIDGIYHIKNKEVDEIKNKLNLNIVDLSTRSFLIHAITSETLKLSHIAHSYLEISRILYELLRNYGSDIKNLKNLKIGFNDLLSLIQIIQEKEPKQEEIRVDENDSIQFPEKNSIWNNKNNLFSSLEFYQSIIQNKKSNIYLWIANGILAILAFFGLWFPLK